MFSYYNIVCVHLSLQIKRLLTYLLTYLCLNILDVEMQTSRKVDKYTSLHKPRQMGFDSCVGYKFSTYMRRDYIDENW